MSKYNLVWLIIISLVLLLLQVNEIHAREIAAARFKERPSATLEDRDVVMRVQRSKREGGGTPTPDNDVAPSTTNEGDDNDYGGHVPYDDYSTTNPLDDTSEYVYGYDDVDPVLEKVTRVPLGKYPFMVAVERLDVGEPELCAGSIFTELFVLIGASCAGSTERERDPTKYTIVAGINNLTAHSLKVGQKRKVTEIVLDEASDPRIALLRLDVPLRFNENVKAKRISFERFLGWRPCTVIQWGNIKKNSTTSWTLLKLDMQVYDGAKCRQKSDSVQGVDMSRSMCAFSLGQNKNPVCRGGGTVLYCDNVITGFRRRNDPRCSIVNQTTVYTDLGSFALWTRNYAPKTVYNGLPLVIRSIRRADTPNNHSNNIDAIVFLSLSSALALFIFA